MKNYLLIITLLLIGLSACTNTEKNTDEAENTAVETTESITMPHGGSWTRNFEIGKDSTQYVYYTIWEDSIKYEMRASWR